MSARKINVPEKQKERDHDLINAEVALTHMIAASKPSEKDNMIKVILNLLKE